MISKSTIHAVCLAATVLWCYGAVAQEFIRADANAEIAAARLYVPDSVLKDAASQFPPMPLGSADMAQFVVGFPTFTSGTPINDVFYTLLDTDYIDGENAGSDVFLPVDPSDEFPGSDSVKLVRCSLNTDLDISYGSAQGDRIILGTGEVSSPFFSRGADGIDNDYAVVLHFDYEFGLIQLRGNRSDYRLTYCTLADGCATEGWYLFYTGAGSADLIAFVYPCSVIIPSISGLPPNDPNPYCSPSGKLSLDNPAQFVFAGPVDPIPAVVGGGWQFGGTGKEIVGGVAVDIDGNVYVVGATDSNLDAQEDAAHELFVTRFAPDGSVDWVSEIPMSEGSMLMDAVADDQHLYACGRTLGSLPGFLNAGRWDGIILKLRLDDGTLVGTHQWGNHGIDGYGNIELDGNGSLFVSGQGSPAGPPTNDDAYLVAKYRAADLQNEWRLIDSVAVSGFAASAEAWAGITYDEPRDRLIVGGWYLAAAGADGFIAVYEGVAGLNPVRSAFRTVRSMGTRAEWVFGTGVDDLGRIYAAGYTTGGLSGQPLGNGDAYLVRYDQLLDNPEYRQLGTPETDAARSLTVDSQGNALLLGFTHGDLSGDNASVAIPTSDVFIARFNSDLDLVGTVQVGTSGEEHAESVLVGHRLYVAGMTEGSLVEQTAGSFDGFVLTLDAESLTPVAPSGPCGPADTAAPFGVLDDADVHWMLDAVERNDPAADLDGDGYVDFFDVLKHLQQFDVGC